jgi:hypothetical protein
MISAIGISISKMQISRGSFEGFSGAGWRQGLGASRGEFGLSLDRPTKNRRQKSAADFLAIAAETYLQTMLGLSFARARQA